MTDEIREVTQRLRAAAPGWAARDVEERIGVLARWGREFTARRDDFVAALAADTGRLALSELEVDWVLGALDRGSRWARELFASLSVRQSSDPTVTLGEALVPLGLVGVISPWNFPLQLALIDAIPALLSGCVVVLKPSEITPTFAPILQATIDAVPDLAEVFAVIEGGPDTGREIVQSVDAVSFTGSVRTGRHVAGAAAEAFIPAFLELGGKDAVVVAADADLDVATSGILWGSTANTGQSCMSLERVYVEESVADEFIDEIVRKAEQVTLAIPGPADGDMGPFIDPRQADVVAGHLADAVSKGAKIACGGDLEEHGGRRFMRPTVVIGVDHTMALMTEETFGPVIPVMPVRDLDEAVRMANDTEYGLSAAVFAAPETAPGIARQLLAGAISINDVCLSGLVPEGEKQSFKSSGLGPSRMGPASLRRFLRQRAVLTRTQPQIQPWWYGDGTPKE